MIILITKANMIRPTMSSIGTTVPAISPALPLSSVEESDPFSFFMEYVLFSFVWFVLGTLSMLIYIFYCFNYCTSHVQLYVIATKVKGNSCESVSQLDAATAHIVVICVLPLSGSNFDTYPDILYVDLIKWIKTNIVMSACLFTLQNQLSLNYQFPNSFFLTKYLGYRNERNILTGNYAVGMGLLLKRKVSPQLRFRSFNFQV